jgi:hypothetical protein
MLQKLNAKIVPFPAFKSPFAVASQERRGAAWGDASDPQIWSAAPLIIGPTISFFPTRFRILR